MTEPPLRTFGDAARLTAGVVNIIDDMPGAVDRLVNIAGTRRFEHTVAQLREEQASATSALVKLVVAEH
jgi:hypothetical protein